LDIQLDGTDGYHGHNRDDVWRFDFGRVWRGYRFSCGHDYGEPGSHGSIDRITTDEPDSNGWTDGQLQRDCNRHRAVELSMAKEWSEHHGRYVGFVYNTGHDASRQRF
jgi:hypothetical protein